MSVHQYADAPPTHYQYTCQFISTPTLRRLITNTPVSASVCRRSADSLPIHLSVHQYADAAPTHYQYTCYCTSTPTLRRLITNTPVSAPIRRHCADSLLIHRGLWFFVRFWSRATVGRAASARRVVLMHYHSHNRLPQILHITYTHVSAPVRRRCADSLPIHMSVHQYADAPPTHYQYTCQFISTPTLRRLITNTPVSASVCRRSADSLPIHLSVHQYADAAPTHYQYTCYCTSTPTLRRLITNTPVNASRCAGS